MKTLLGMPAAHDVSSDGVTYWSRFDDVYCAVHAALEELGGDEHRAWLDEYGRQQEG